MEEVVCTHYQVFETRPEQVNNENIVKPFLAKVVYLRDASCARIGIMR